MPDTINLKVAKRGVVTLPKSLRETYKIKPGDNLTLLDLGGVFLLSLLSPHRSEIDAIAERISETLIARGETLESMLKALREERERYAVESAS